MRDTSEFPDGTEQAKNATTRTRNPARSKSESNVPGSQEQETRPAPRRRSHPNTQAATRQQGGNENGTPPPPSAGRTAGTQQSHTGPSSPRSSGTSHARSGASSSTQRVGHGATQAQRPVASHSAAPTAAPARPAPGSHRPGGTSQRQHGQTSQQRSTHAGHSSGAPAQQGTTSGPAQRSPSRPGGATRPGGGATRSGEGGRPGNRPATTQRPAERRAATVKEKPTGPIALPAQIVVKDLAERLHTSPNEIIRTLIKHSIFANINQVVDYEKAALVATDLGFEPTQSTAAPSGNGERALSANEAMVAARDNGHTIHIPPVVTIMGHVDHGKTSLLDTIRKTKVAAGEAGGITQHIGAYQVEVNGKKITFLDTPGHEAFTAMRARGAQSTHIVIIVIAADDGVMPQTREAIDHARAAKVPIIIALNKIDKANANPDRVKQQLAEINILIEEYGGDVVCVPISAKRGTGIDELLEYILLVAELQDIRADPNRPATGIIIEAKLEKNSGPSATVLVQQGTLKMGDNIVVGTMAGKVRAMFNDRGKRIQKAPPSTPVSILGLSEVPQAGDRLEVAVDEKTARQRAQQELDKRQDEAQLPGQVSLDTLYIQMQEGKVKELNVVLKSDVQGSSEAIKGSLSKLGEENMKVRLIHEGIGNVSEADIHLAAASKAIIIAFNVKADGAALREAQKEGVDIRYYNVIYKLIDDIQAALVGLLEPTYREVIEGHAEVLQTFKAGKTIVAGCRITDGKILRSSLVRLMRDGTKVFEGKIASLRRGKDDVREVASGYECGILLEDFNEIEVGDILEGFSQERVLPRG
jgi:translation initiation factor IF-2